MTTVNTLLKLEDLSVTEPSVDFDAIDEKTKKPILGMRFMNIIKAPGNRKLILRVHGKTASEINTVYDADSFKFKPNNDELDNLLAIEKLVDDVYIPDEYEHRSALNGDHQLNIKLKMSGDSFKASVPFTPLNATEVLVSGKNCIIEVVPSFYFHADEKDPSKKFYGVFYQLQDLKFPDDEVKSKTVKSKGKSRVAAH